MISERVMINKRERKKEEKKEEKNVVLPHFHGTGTAGQLIWSTPSIEVATKIPRWWRILIYLRRSITYLFWQYVHTSSNARKKPLLVIQKQMLRYWREIDITYDIVELKMYPIYRRKPFSSRDAYKLFYPGCYCTFYNDLLLLSFYDGQMEL